MLMVSQNVSRRIVLKIDTVEDLAVFVYRSSWILVSIPPDYAIRLSPPLMHRTQQNLKLNVLAESAQLRKHPSSCYFHLSIHSCSSPSVKVNAFEALSRAALLSALLSGCRPLSNLATSHLFQLNQPDAPPNEGFLNTAAPSLRSHIPYLSPSNFDSSSCCNSAHIRSFDIRFFHCSLSLRIGFGTLQLQQFTLLPITTRQTLQSRHTTCVALRP